MHHRASGFSQEPLAAYLEFWGIMQTIIIQQDSLKELHEAITGSSLNSSSMTSWQEIRMFRNIAAGHPARRDRPKSTPLTRSFLGRKFGNYNQLTYEKWSTTGIEHPKINLGKLVDNYASEASDIAQQILNTMQQRWPHETT